MGQPRRYDVTTVLAVRATLPCYRGSRDAPIVGDHLSWSDFQREGQRAHTSSDVTPVGCLWGAWQITDPAWQAAAFVMPPAWGTDDNRRREAAGPGGHMACVRAGMCSTMGQVGVWSLLPISLPGDNFYDSLPGAILVTQ